ncbi:MAG: TetR/AcrR family transcriptional regulator [Gemmatimonadaceae bacterium]|nr:TetR/AcrR family transcriptional regulator [Acetobacteraceae bacterium]
MTSDDRPGGSRDSYHHGNLREALIAAALTMIAERGLAGFAISEIARAVGVSPAAPYRHFRDRNALLAEVARRGFQSLGADMEAASASARADPVAALERCAKAYLAFARREPATFTAMFDGPADPDAALRQAQDAAIAVIRRAADAACANAPGRPPAMMVALHVWSLAHGIATLFVLRDEVGQARRLPVPPDDLLEAGLYLYVQALGMAGPR